MNHATKAALLSAVICPGAGHLYLKSYPKAIALLIIVITAIAVIVRQALISAQLVIDKIQAKGGALDINQILILVEDANQQGGGQLVAIATYSILGCWLLALIDAYRLGKKMPQHH